MGRALAATWPGPSSVTAHIYLPKRCSVTTRPLAQVAAHGQWVSLTVGMGLPAGRQIWSSASGSRPNHPKDKDARIPAWARWVLGRVGLRFGRRNRRDAP